VVLPTLVVLALVAVVAIAATGSTPDGSNATRPPSESLLDTLLNTLFNLGLLAVVAGGVLVAYGLTQRRAIGEEVRSGRYRRTSLMGWLAFLALFAAFAYFHPRNRPFQPQEAGDALFGGRRVPTSPDQDPGRAYEASIQWIPTAVILGLVLTAVIAYFVAERRARRERTPRAELAEELAAALDDALDDLRGEADARRAVIAAYARLERILASSGVARHSAETSDEYLARVLRDLTLGSNAITRLTRLFTQAKFSQHEVDTAMKEEAIDSLERVRDELRAAANERQDPDRHAVAVGARS
jgi:hypothetical protein